MLTLCAGLPRLSAPDFVVMHGVGHGPIIEATHAFVKYMLTNINP